VHICAEPARAGRPESSRIAASSKYLCKAVALSLSKTEASSNCILPADSAIAAQSDGNHSEPHRPAELQPVLGPRSRRPALVRRPAPPSAPRRASAELDSAPVPLPPGRSQRRRPARPAGHDGTYLTVMRAALASFGQEQGTVMRSPCSSWLSSPYVVSNRSGWVWAGRNHQSVTHSKQLQPSNAVSLSQSRTSALTTADRRLASPSSQRRRSTSAALHSADC